MKYSKGPQEVVDTRTDYERQEQELYTVPNDLRKLKEGVVNQCALPQRGMVSNTVLSGTPEFDLWVDAKTDNIEATEGARLKYIKDGFKWKRTADGIKRPDSGLCTAGS